MHIGEQFKQLEELMTFEYVMSFNKGENQIQICIQRKNYETMKVLLLGLKFHFFATTQFSFTWHHPETNHTIKVQVISDKEELSVYWQPKDYNPVTLL